MDTLRTWVGGIELCTFMMESLIKSSSATSSNSETGNSDSPKMMLPPRYKLTWPLTFTIKQEILQLTYLYIDDEKGLGIE